MNDAVQRPPGPGQWCGESAGTPPVLKAAGLSVHRQFERQAAAFPERTAVRWSGGSLTYRALNERAEALAQRLRQRGLGAGRVAGVMLERSPEMIASLLAVLKAGAAYLPLDSQYPAERLSWMAHDGRLAVVLTTAELASRVRLDSVEYVLADGPDTAPPAASTITPAENDGDGESPAYIMYTSGSTGTPKGVVIPHRGIVRLVCGTDYVDIQPTDVFLHHSAASFDASTFEIWGALLNGAQLALLPPGPASLPALAAAIEQHGVTVLWLTGGLFNLMVDERVGDLRPLRQLLAGGEALSAPHVRRALAALPDTQLINGYGPTENTTFTCCHRIQGGEEFSHGVPIGRPIRGTTVHIVDEKLQEVAAGETGELVAGGLGLALGYWNQPDLTAERFVNNTIDPSSGPKLYRTGDYARQRADGSFEFLGRRDNQIKLRGFRIDLGEIESVLRTHPSVRDCAAAVHAADPGGKQLVAFIVPKDAAAPALDDLRRFLADRLPSHMIPAGWQFQAALPLNANGKVDRVRLVYTPRAEAAPAAAATPLEGAIAGLWREVLGGQRPFGMADSFFDVGGDSLLLAQIHQRFGARTGHSVELTDLFRFPSVSSLAKHLQQRGAATVAAAANDRARRQQGALSNFRRH